MDADSSFSFMSESSELENLGVTFDSFFVGGRVMREVAALGEIDPENEFMMTVC